MRKSFKVAPGVRMTVTPRGVGASVGGKAARVSVHSSGRVTKSASIPGSGISYVSSGGGRRGASASHSNSRAAAPTPAADPKSSVAPKPALMAPRWEKDLYKVANSSEPKSGDFVEVGRSDPKARQAAMLLDMMMTAMPSGDNTRAKDILEVLQKEGFDPHANPFLSKYFAGAMVRLLVTDQVTIYAPVDKDMLALTLAELRQSDGDIDGAIDLVESVEPSIVAAVSLAELYADRERWADVIEMTDGAENIDDLTTYLLIQRGVAFREQRHFEASRESLKKALASRSRPKELRHLALIERGQTYIREGKKAMARKDFEKVLAENSNYPGLSAHLASIEG